jgi:hypothetical protein
VYQIALRQELSVAQAMSRALLGVMALLLGLFAALAPAGIYAAEAVGKATLVRGAVTAQTPGSAARLLGTGSEVFAAEVVTTGRSSVAVLEMIDGTRMALRPGTVFQIDKYDAAPQSESVLLTLFRGGMRAVTGFISKRSKSAFRVRSASATIGIRGTTFDVRVCGERGSSNNSCADEADNERLIAGRVALARGNVVLEAPSGVPRKATAGARIREGDTVRTGVGAFAVVLLNDGSRASVAQDSEFRIDRIRVDVQTPSRSEALLSFVRGGLRLLTGAIARGAPSRYKIRTPAATIGIRGTGLDLQCQGLCVSPPDTGAGPTGGDGLFAKAWLGTIDFDGRSPLSDGSLFVANPNDTPIPVADIPRACLVPRPDQVQLPPLPVGADTPLGRGVYVSCYAGNCDLSGPQGEVQLEAGESGVLAEGEGTPQPLPEIPEFQADDPFLRAIQPQFRRVFELLGDPSKPQGGLECRV